jgi:hypothetical protein
MPVKISTIVLKPGSSSGVSQERWPAQDQSPRKIMRVNDLFIADVFNELPLSPLLYYIDE